MPFWNYLKKGFIQWKSSAFVIYSYAFDRKHRLFYDKPHLKKYYFLNVKTLSNIEIGKDFFDYTEDKMYLIYKICKDGKIFKENFG